MQMRHGEFSESQSMREALKRGRAREALTTASSQPIAPERLFDLVMDARPNAKSAKRLLARAKRRAGVTNVSGSPCGKSFLVVGRYVKTMMFKKPDELLEYSDTVITYIGVRLQARRAGMSVWAAGLSFGKHALERFVERSDVDFHAPILPHIDAEAKQIFRSWENEEVIPERDGQHYRAMKPGTWSGFIQDVPMEREWGRFVSALPRLPMFCARTFLSDEEMRPTVWMRAYGAPNCQLL